MSLSSFALQRMLLILVVGVVVLRFPTGGAMMLNMLCVLLHSLRIHLLQRVQGQLDVRDQNIASRAREVLSHNNSHELELLAMWRHSISRHNPPALTQVMSHSEFIVVILGLGVEAEGYEW